MAIDYSKWDDIWVESDDDEDCPRNIEKYTWRRLKQRTRKEKGCEKKEPELTDAWNSTSVTHIGREAQPEAKKDPSEFLKKYKEDIDHYGDLNDIKKADGYLLAKPHLVEELTEGYLISKAIDLAIINKNDANLTRLAERCLQIHSIVKAAEEAKMPPSKSVIIFYKHLKNPETAKLHYAQIKKQIPEIMERIAVRRKERIAERNKAEEEEKAPLGPGGLDPTEVLNSLPEKLQECFMSKNVQKLQNVLKKMKPEEAEYHMKRCVDSGLWVANASEAENEVDDNEKS